MSQPEKPPAGHPLDRPVWQALTGPQAHFAITSGTARRFDPAYGPFAAAIDDSGPSLHDLAQLAARDEIWLLEKHPPLHIPGLTALKRADCVQMVAHTLTAAPSRFPVMDLGADDAPDMLALATSTQPGPFRARTHALGRFIGIRDAGRLVAMAGERTQPAGYVEVSGVCTHPDHRGRGYVGLLMREVAARILARGTLPFLHCYATNAGAIALYRSLGFTPFQTVTAAAFAVA
ncbi:GNAT family N-acetyltransferase [Gluconacetobacter takamatsuzukensis]|uniref:GNAT family N-acetyltransferase n=1 Tax=Gluconacetobacter takamatsuzukensis TaxID=1286190 RepID=A0A7W4KEC1_9PROT|nr:GNAT family N-acetyltransferase [Gluconacetobacter takamatsuzukensis]MBB2205334.1 GNAT family N-acetyltransferase [Gluconacetobacter takamatsuzukensis]